MSRKLRTVVIVGIHCEHCGDYTILLPLVVPHSLIPHTPVVCKDCGNRRVIYTMIRIVETRNRPYTEIGPFRDPYAEGLDRPPKPRPTTDVLPLYAP